MGINLVPQRVCIRRKGKRRIALIAKMFLIITIAAPFCAGIVAGSNSDGSEKVSTQEDQALVRGISHQVNLLSKDIDRLVVEEQNIARHHRDRDELIHVLSSFAREYPRGITLTAIKYAAKENSFVGIAKDQESLLRFFRTLTQRGFMGSPKIRKTSWKRVDGLTVLEFEVAMLRDAIG